MNPAHSLTLLLVIFAAAEMELSGHVAVSHLLYAIVFFGASEAAVRAIQEGNFRR